ncbi:hypothetical protein [Pseudoalteromonas peptidolytica]|uniref:Uncharacterized protein n=1 Tax=Pseudoalteromonas peptidolytica F12-50-A1 TaxID=1315280 RepID=A0A8I0MYA6_9GAMM|nr:hypothetical protein [Pseudoalteromonas peptidolytica]MBE0348292.1 hypothetical protein [Pseudoalteromonas peptidolytica F12-50-A1]NLR16576.1 hypothetical protein [Pseudoalteromonas peptidolytica]GEK08946.1 hypothetical protein PPE03_11950 [Pseudoalteromonas peptidolytica]
MIHSMGTISLALNSNVIQGSNTYFQTVGKTTTGTLLIIELPQIGSQLLQVVAVVSDTELRVSKVDGTPYLSPVALQNIKYGLCKNFTHTTTAEIAKQLAELTAKWQRRETEMTGWYASDDDAYPVTDFLGTQKPVPTPAFINRLTQVASTASSDLSQMAAAIEQNKQTLATVEPRLSEFESKFTQAQAQNSNVNTKHNEVVLKHGQVSDVFNVVQNMAATVEAKHGEVSGFSESISEQAKQVTLFVEHSSAHSKLSIEAAQAAQQFKAQCEDILTQTQTFGDTLTQSVTDAKSAISQDKNNAITHVAELSEQLTTRVEEAKEQIAANSSAVTTQVNQFAGMIKSSESSAKDAANTAILKANACTIKADELTRSQVDLVNNIAQVAAQIEKPAEQVSAIAKDITNDKANVELLKKHSAAHSAISMLALETMLSNTHNIQAAFSAALDGTLTHDQINNLFN